MSNDNESGIETCRICLEEYPHSELCAEALIAPCRCTGSRKFVHRGCLDTWRATKTGGRSFTHCEVCNFEYEIEVLDEENHDRCRRMKFHAHVARDTIAVFVVIQLIIMAIGGLLMVIDPQGAMRSVLPQWLGEHNKTSYYVWGFFILLVILGIFGLLHVCINGTGRHRAGGDCNFCYCGDPCHCHGGGGDDAAGLLVMLVVIGVILAFIGLFVGIFLASLVLQKIVQRHYRKLWLKSETKKYRVVDLNGRMLPDPATAAVDNVPMAYPVPSAPDMAPQHTYPEGLY